MSGEPALGAPAREAASQAARRPLAPGARFAYWGGVAALGLAYPATQSGVAAGAAHFLFCFVVLAVGARAVGAVSREPLRYRGLPYARTGAWVGATLLAASVGGLALALVTAWLALAAR